MFFFFFIFIFFVDKNLMYLLVHDSYAVPNCFLIGFVVYCTGTTSSQINMVKSPWSVMTEALVDPSCISEVQDIKML